MFEENKKYLTIGEVVERAQVPAYTLRYWEKEFKLLKPERHSGFRKYSVSDIELVIKIKDLLYKQRFTIEGVKKCLSIDKRKKKLQNITSGEFTNSKILDKIKEDLKEILDILQK